MFPTGAKEEWEKCAIELSTAKLTVWKLRHLNLSSPHSFLVLRPPAPADSSVTLSLILSVRLSVCISLSICLSVSLICPFTVSTVSGFLSVRLFLFPFSLVVSVSISGSCKLCFYSHPLWITLLLFVFTIITFSLSSNVLYHFLSLPLKRSPARYRYSHVSEWNLYLKKSLESMGFSQVEAWMAKQWLTVVCYSSLFWLFSSPLFLIRMCQNASIIYLATGVGCDLP